MEEPPARAVDQPLEVVLLVAHPLPRRERRGQPAVLHAPDGTRVVRGDAALLGGGEGGLELGASRARQLVLLAQLLQLLLQLAHLARMPLVRQVRELLDLMVGHHCRLVELVLEGAALLGEGAGDVRALDALHERRALLVRLRQRRQRVVGVAHRLLRALALLLPPQLHGVGQLGLGLALAERGELALLGHLRLRLRQDRRRLPQLVRQQLRRLVVHGQLDGRRRCRWPPVLRKDVLASGRADRTPNGRVLLRPLWRRARVRRAAPRRLVRPWL